MLKNKLFAAMGGEPTDPNFANVTLLLHGDGTNGAQNNTFLDSSTNNFTITRNGNTTQGSFSPFSKEPGKWGVAFKATTDWLTVGSTTALNMGTGDFTVEAWVRVETDSINTVVASNNSTWSAGAVGFWASFGEVRLSAYDYSSSGMFLYGPSGVGAKNTWTHVAVVRSGNSMQIFVNGVGGTAVTVSSGLNINFNTNNATNIGRNPWDGSNGYLTGNLSNLRVVKGTALYTSNFTPPTAPLTAVAGTSLLCCQDNRFKDNSPNNFTLTPNGNVAVTPFSPFANSAAWSAATNGGSGYFSTPATKGLKGSPSSAYAFGLNAFTCECWLFMTRAPLAVQNIGDSSNGGQMALFGWAADNGSLASWRTFFAITSSTGSSWNQAWLRSEQNNGKSSVNSILSTPLSINAWHHIAIVRPSSSSSELKVYINGTLSCTLNVAGADFTFGGTSTVQTVGWTGLIGFEYSVVGYISSARSVTNQAIYTSNFTPPTAPLTPVTNTSLLLNFTNAGIFDNAMMNNLETVGNAQISTSVKKYGTGSISTPTSGYLINSDAKVNLGGGDFTIEFWVNSASDEGGFPGLVAVDSGLTGDYAGIAITKAGVFVSYNGSTWGIFAASMGTVNDGTWRHIAVVRSGSNLYCFNNGALQSTTSITSAVFYKGPAVIVGKKADNFTTGAAYIDDLRITKGVARYTANFTPPAQAFPNK